MLSGSTLSYEQALVLYNLVYYVFRHIRLDTQNICVSFRSGLSVDILCKSTFTTPISPKSSLENVCRRYTAKIWPRVWERPKLRKTLV